ncbi:MAG TPA: Ig-like domain-containing protein, partial [Ramlibacter sp.]|nr:Ig-like domain-containing protein [Ramlibacter sp.]
MATTTSASDDQTIVSGSTSDKIVTGAGDDTVYSGAGSDTINSGSGNDTVDGGAGSDTVLAGSGNDTLIYTLTENFSVSGTTADSYNGGAGYDMLVVNLSLTEWNTQQIKDQIYLYLNKLATVARNANTGEVSNGQASDFTFNFVNAQGQQATLTVQMTERLVVKIGDTVIIDSSDKSAATLTAPDLTTGSDSGSSNADNVTNATGPVFCGVGADPLATIRLLDAQGNCIGTGTAGLDGKWTCQVSGSLSDGNYQISVVQTDLAGNASFPSAALSVTVDTTADADNNFSVSVAAGDEVTNNAEKGHVTLNLSGVDTDAVSVAISVDDGDPATAAVTTTATKQADGTWQVADLNIGSLSDGPVTVSATVTDTAGNTKSVTDTLTLDTSADLGTPLSVSVTDELVNNTERTAVAYTVSGLDADATATVTFSDGTNQVVVTGASGTANLSTLTDGTITASVSATDTAGNTATGAGDSLTLDTTAPVVASVTMSDTALKIGDTSTVTIAFSEAVTGFSNADVTVENGTLDTLTSSDGGLTWTATFTPSSNIEDATNVVTVAASYTDVAGNDGSGGASANYAVDTKAPVVASVTMSDTALKIGDTSTVTIAFSEAVTGFSNADVTVENGTLDTLTSSDGGLTWTATFTP